MGTPWTWIAVAVVAVAVLGWLVVARNRLVWRRNRVRNGWAQIDVQLQRRADLVPSLVEAVRGYMAHERGVFEAVTRARGAVDGAGNDVAARVEAEGALAASTRRLLAVAEGYPELRAAENVRALQEDLLSTENRVAFARQHYNDEVLAYNTAVQSFPVNLVARIFVFSPAVLFAIDDDELRSVPRVDLA